MTRRVRIGTFGFCYPPFEAAIQAAVTAEGKGYEFVAYWDQTNGYYPSAMHTPEFTALAQVLPDHDAFFDSGPLISAAGQRTAEIGFVYGVIDSVRRPPHNLAQTMLTLDHATHGRTTTIVATGEQKQMRPYGVSRKGAGDKLWDLVHMVKLLCQSSEPVSYEGRIYKMDRALISLEPFSGSAPKLWVAGGTADATYLAGTLADGWVAAAPGYSEADPGFVKAKVREVHEHARAAGRDPSSIDICLMAACLVDEDPGALNLIRDNLPLRWITNMFVTNSNVYSSWGLVHPFGENWGYSQKLIPYQFSLEEALDICHRTPREAVDKAWFVGNVEQVVSMMEPYVAAGVTDILLCNWAPFGGFVDYTDDLHRALRAEWSDRAVQMDDAGAEV
jgi:phthiodiolone/phenolphthiodiolone dimycocerosates ketoreductase